MYVQNLAHVSDCQSRWSGGGSHSDWLQPHSDELGHVDLCPIQQRVQIKRIGHKTEHPL
jgi:hypothetical protein